MAFHPLEEGCHKTAGSLMKAGCLVPVAFLDMASEAASFLPSALHLAYPLVAFHPSVAFRP